MGFIDYEVDGAVGIITINRPKALNALNEDVLKLVLLPSTVRRHSTLSTKMFLTSWSRLLTP